MKIRNKILSLILTLSLVFTVSAPIYAHNDSNALNSTGNDIYLDDVVSSENMDFLLKLEQIFEYVELDNDNLILNLTEKELIEKYNFNQDEVYKINELLVANKSFTTNQSNENYIKPQVYVKDWKIHFSAIEVQDYFLAAAQIGPAAIVLALTALGSVVPGVGTVVGILGAGAIAYTVTQALAQHRGMYIGITWNGIFPNPDMGVK